MKSHVLHMKLIYHRGTSRRAMSVEILSTDAHLYEKSHFEGLHQVRDLQRNCHCLIGRISLFITHL